MSDESATNTNESTRALRQLEQIVGREPQLQALGEALGDSASRVLYLVGDGGMGKTRLLLEICHQAKHRSDTPVVGPLDLFLTEHQQPIALMTAIVRELKQQLVTGTAFDAFDEAVADLLAEDISGGEARRAQVRDIFLSGFRTALVGKRVVLALDTFEKLHPNLQGTQDYNFRSNRQMEQWLVGLLATLLDTGNVLVVLAGRPRTQQKELLEQQLKQRLQPVEVGAFSFEESQDYLAAVLADKALPAEELQEAAIVLHKIADGRPVILALTAALWVAGVLNPAALPPDFPERYPDNREQLSAAFINWIQQQLAMLDPVLTLMLEIAVVLRRGLRPDLFERLLIKGKLAPELRDRFAQFHTFVFVKVNEDSAGVRTITLHDEMYELMLAYALESVNADQWYKLAIHYAEEQIAALPEPERGAALLRHRQQRQTYETDILFYRLASNVAEGYQFYREIVYNTIISDDVDYDDQLQDDIARFFDRETLWGAHYIKQLQLASIGWNDVVAQEGIHWVYRRTLQLLPQQKHLYDALELAKRVRQQIASSGKGRDSGEQVLLDTSLTIAERFAADSFAASLEPQVVKEYDRVLNELEAVRQGARREMPQASLRMRQTTLQQAIALNNLGYYERKFNSWGVAVRHYREALKRYQELPEANVARARAIALNNYGFVLSLEGRPEDGLQYVDQALKINRSAGALQRVAVSLNTRAQILLQQGRLEEALRSVTRALDELEIGSPTPNLALVLRAKGEVHRRIAFELQLQRERSEEEFALAIAYYERALRHLAEVPRRIQATQELGVSYRNRAFSRRRRGEPIEDDLERAVAEFGRALQAFRSQPTPPVHDALLAGLYHDLAVAYYLRGETEAMNQALDDARAAIPPAYRINPSGGLNQNAETSQQQIYWLRLGQIEFQRGRGDFNLYIINPTAYPSKAEDGFILVLRAFACFNQYSRKWPGWPTIARLAREDLVALGDVARVRELEEQTYYQAVIDGLTGEPYTVLARIVEEAITEIELGQ